MEIIEEYSNDSTISNISDLTDSSFILNSDDLILLQNPDEMSPKIQSITSTLNLDCSLNLKIISQKIKSSEINQNNKSSLIIKFKDNNTLITLFSNGKLICSGAKSEKVAKSNCLKIAKIIRKLGYDIKIKEYKIQNIIANYEINFKLDLNILYKNICDCFKNANCKFDKNVFQGVIVYINGLNVTIFESGKIVISGAKNKNDIENIFKQIFPLINEAKG